MVTDNTFSEHESHARLVILKTVHRGIPYVKESFDTKLLQLPAQTV